MGVLKRGGVPFIGGPFDGYRFNTDGSMEEVKIPVVFLWVWKRSEPGGVIVFDMEVGRGMQQYINDHKEEVAQARERGEFSNQLAIYRLDREKVQYVFERAEEI